MGKAREGNSKEVMVLLILIFFVLVSTSRAEHLILELGDNSAPPIVEAQPNEQNLGSWVSSYTDRLVGDDSVVDIGVVTASSLSQLPDDYGLIVKLTAQF